MDEGKRKSICVYFLFDVGVMYAKVTYVALWRLDCYWLLYMSIVILSNRKYADQWKSSYCLAKDNGEMGECVTEMMTDSQTLGIP